MIPQEIQRFFVFIDYLDENKAKYMKYIPLCNELIDLSAQRDALNPSGNYKDKLRYDDIQNKISEKFLPITEEIYNPITNKLRELEVWSGDTACASIWNNSISSIYEFQKNFTEEEAIQVIEYKQKYLDFRNETNTNFLSLGLVFSSLDGILKELFGFFKETDANEFEKFEPKRVNVNSIKEALKVAIENGGKNVIFSLPSEGLFPRPIQTQANPSMSVIHNNKIVMGDNTEIRDISNNSGHIFVGKKINPEINSKDGFTEKSFHWQKWLGIIGVIIAIIGIVISLFLE